MSIQWFPGHMTQARKKAAETMAQTDLVIEVVDARIPEASCNPMIHELRLHRQRPCLKLLNKADLADPAATRAWIEHYNAQPGVKAVAISCRKPGEAQRVPTAARALAPHRGDTLKPLRMMIMGIPNVGKSTLMNALLGRRVAAVGDEPAVTKSQQRIELSPELIVVDTPGMLWPKIVHPHDGLMLAVCHAVGRNAVIDEEVAVFLAGLLLERYPAALPERYGLKAGTQDAVGVVEAIARKRGCLIKGRAGELDLEKAAMILLTDFRDGRLGRISLETPESRATMLATAAVSETSTPAGNGPEKRADT
jgi:ribosome biogenesis GTPase A